MGRKKLAEDERKTTTALKASPATLQKVEEIAGRLDTFEGTINRLAHLIGLEVLDAIMDDDEILRRLAEYYATSPRRKAKATHASRSILTTDEMPK